MALHVAKFHRVTPPNLKVIGANTLNYKPILTPFKKIVRGTPIRCGVWASKTWPFCGALNNFGAQHPLWVEIWSSKKSILWVNISHENAVESGPKFTSLLPSNARGYAVDNLVLLLLTISICCGNIRAQSGKGSEIVPNLACFLPPNFLGEQTPKLLDRHL